VLGGGGSARVRSQRMLDGAWGGCIGCAYWIAMYSCIVTQRVSEMYSIALFQQSSKNGHRAIANVQLGVGLAGGVLHATHRRTC